MCKLVEEYARKVYQEELEAERKNSIQEMIKNLYRSNVALEIVKESIKNAFHLDESQTMNFIAEFYK